MRDLVKADLIADEGRSNKLYRCPAGAWTVGVGHNIQERGISDAAIELILDEDLDEVFAALDRTDPGWREHPVSVQRALVNLMFNLGETRWLKFKTTRAALSKRDYSSTAEGLRNSKWFTQVQRSRSTRIINQILEGEGHA